MDDEPTPEEHPGLGTKALLGMASGLALAADAWAPLLKPHPNARTGIRILATDRYDVWVLKWPVGTAVSPHHHGNSEAAFAVVSGVLKETRWVGNRPHSRLVRHGQGVTVERGVVHDVGADGVEALSVHVYSPPLSQMAFFDELATTLLLEESVDPNLDAVIINRPGAHLHPGRLETLLESARARIAPRMQASELTTAMQLGALIIDTRPAELRRRDGELPGAHVVERNVLEWRLDPVGSHRIPEASDPARPVVVVCDEGYASSIAAAALLDLGRRNVTDLAGGYQEWKRLAPHVAAAS